MNRIGRAAMLLFLGAVVGRLILSGGFGWFVQQRMRWPLIVATVILLVFGVYEAVSGFREEEHDPNARGRSKGPRVGWMMVLPLLVLLSVAPTGLGASAADRVDAFVPTESTSNGFEPLDSSAGTPALSVFEFIDRAAWDTEKSLLDTPVRLEGLVVNDPDVADGFKLTRFMVSCCAADGVPLQVTVHGTSRGYENDTWVIADVTWREPDVPYQNQTGDWEIEADVLAITEVPDAPNDPYESPYSF